MDHLKPFLEKILAAHRVPKVLPGANEVASFERNIMQFLFPELNDNRLETMVAVERQFERLHHDFEKLLQKTTACDSSMVPSICQQFFTSLEEVYALCHKDAEAILHGDPAATDKHEVIRTYPGFYAIAVYRIAHLLYTLNIPYLPRILTEYAHSQTGIDIHPGAKIGRSFFIDHGTGIVVGETTVIGDNVKIYQGVTLGALSVSKELANQKRHPTIEDNVVIYASATILGGETVIGANSIIGGNAWVISSVPPNSRIYYSPSTEPEPAK